MDLRGAISNETGYIPVNLCRAGFAITFLLVGLCASTGVAAQSQGDTKAVTASRHVLKYRARPSKLLRVITPNDPDFDNAMSMDFPGYMAVPNYQASRPFLVILHNDTQQTARAYRVIWRGRVSGGSPQNDDVAIVGEQEAITTPLEMRWPGGSWQTDKAIRPGESRLLSPLFNGRRGEAGRFAFLNKPGELPSAKNYSDISAELDCVVYADGSFAGINQGRLLLRYFVTRDAQHDEALSVARRLRILPSDPELNTIFDLRRNIATSNSYPNEGAVPIYIKARGLAAQELKRVLHEDGYQKLQSTVEALVTQMPPHERFTSFGGLYHRSKFHVNGATVSPRD